MKLARWQAPAEGDYYTIVPSGISATDLDFVIRYALWVEDAIRLNGQDQLLLQNHRWETIHQNSDADDRQTGTFNDNQSPGILSKYKDAVMNFLHAQMLPVMTEAVGFDLLPTYTYFRVYRDGAILESHVDRAACEVSASLLIGTSSDVIWPLWIDGEEITQKPGDLIIYRGCDTPHWRAPLQAPYEFYQVQAFLHYVDANGPYTMCSSDAFRPEEIG